METTDALRRVRDALARTGFTVLGAGASAVDTFRDGDAGKTLRNRLDTFERRGRRAWPRIEDRTERAVQRSQSVAGDKAKRVRHRAERSTGVHPNYDEMTVDELYDRAQSAGVAGRSDMTKEELIEALRRHEAPDFESMTIDDLREIARKADVQGRSQMKKNELVEALNEQLGETRRELVSSG